MDERFVHWYHNQTNVHPIGLLALVVLAGAMLAVPRRFGFLPVLILASVIPSAQRIVVAGLDFTFLRLLVLAGFIRVFSRSEARGFRWTPLDYSVIALIVVSSLTYTARVRTFAGLVLQLGEGFDAVGMYMLSRWLIRSWRDLDRLALSAILVSIPTALFFLVESQTGRNLFSIFGGVAEITTVREGRLRCMGAFGNAILAGCFWASLMPLMAARGLRPGASRGLSIVGLCAALVIVVACASSTPLMGVAMGLVALAIFPFRGSMRAIRWGLVAVLLGLHLVMKKPVWHLISRIDLVGGSTGYHRYKLIDSFIRNIDEWFLVGTGSTAHWGWGLFDIANQYVAYGVRGGILSFALFIAVLALAFRQTGLVLHRVRGDRSKTAYAWAAGTAVFMHVCMFFAVSYFGQIEVVFYASLGVIASLTVTTMHAPVPAAKRPERPAASVDESKPWRPAGLADALFGRGVGNRSD
jgi:hypothetical protein